MKTTFNNMNWHMDWPVVLNDVGLGCIKITLLIIAVLVPLMIVAEIIRDIRLFDRVAFLIKPVLKFFSLPGEAAFPLLGGFFFGITYGSGLILPFTRDDSLRKRDLMIIFIFLSLCHGMIEDTLIFMAIGANGLILISLRIIIALVAVLVVMKILTRTNRKS